MTKWTIEQEKAINLKGKNLLVSAAAGSGKTAVLVERIISLIIQDKVDIDRLLVVTFTNAAAAEMRERISLVLTRELEKNDENEEHLRRQLNLLNKSSISTLHAFCIQVLRKNFYNLGIDPSFKIGDQGELLLLKQEALEETLEEAYKESNKNFKNLVDSYSENNKDEKIEILILSIYSFIQSQPYPFKWLEEQVDMFKKSFEEFLSSLWMEEIKKSILIDIKGIENLIEECITIANSPEGPSPYLEGVTKDKEKLRYFKKNLDEYFKGNVDKSTIIFSTERLNRIKKTDGYDSILIDQFKLLRDNYKKTMDDLFKKDFFCRDLSSYYEDIIAMHSPLRGLYELTLRFYNKFQFKKQEKSLVDFNDLEHYALKVLEDEEIAKTYREQYQYVFVDEYQDSNLVQETIINRVKGEDNLFLVGDVKQSIYKFRLADPGLFIDKYLRYISGENMKEERIDLSKNFRSRKEILEGINFVFKKLMTKEVGEIEYSEDAWLYNGAEYGDIENPSIEINIIDKHEDEDYEELEEMDLELKDLSDAETEAYFISGKIKELIGKDTYDIKMGEYKEITYKDIVVLLRSAKNWANVFSEIFIKEGIPVYADDNQGYFDTLEIKIFLNLLKIIDNKKDDLSLLSVMRSPIGNYSTEELIEIRKESPKVGFHEALSDYILNNENELASKLKLFIEKIVFYEEKSKYQKTEEFMWELMIDTGFYYYVGSMIKGQQRQANLKFLLERASFLEKQGRGGLFNFIRFSEDFKKAKGEMGIAKTIGENENVVRIMTIHKSKGLEFPVVIIAAFGKGFNIRDQIGDVLLHKDMGIGPKFVNPETRIYRDTLPQLSIKKATRMENASEEMRILYVALTRGKDKLILCGTLNNIDKSVLNWSTSISSYEILKLKSYLDWIGLCLIRHKEGEILRKKLLYGDIKGMDLSDNSKWSINIFNKKEILESIKEKENEKKLIKDNLVNFNKNDLALISEDLIRKFSWEYPDKNSKKIPSKITVSDLEKVSVSDLKKILYRIPALVKQPAFLEGEKVFSASEKGIIIHFFMQNCDLGKVSNEEELLLQIHTMKEKELLTLEEANILDPKKILKFFQSKLGKRMLSSKNIKREVSFVYKTDVSDVLENAEELDQELFIQGIIDCYFEENGEYILLDYKTDFVNEGSEEELLEKYNSQLKIYKEALEKISGKKVKEAFLYSFAMDKEILQV